MDKESIFLPLYQVTMLSNFPFHLLFCGLSIPCLPSCTYLLSILLILNVCIIQSPKSTNVTLLVTYVSPFQHSIGPCAFLYCNSLNSGQTSNFHILSWLSVIRNSGYPIRLEIFKMKSIQAVFCNQKFTFNFWQSGTYE